ncbi:MAG: hypothetical protein ACKOOL_11635 [Novosphingobium sp.]
MKLPLFGIVALVPLMLGTQPAVARVGRDLVTPLCGGGVVVIHLGGRSKAPQMPCTIKGCHAGCSRRFFDSEQ